MAANQGTLCYQQQTKRSVLPTTTKALCITNNIDAPSAQKLGNGDGSSHVSKQLSLSLLSSITCYIS